jgi:hypothetical protein
MLLIEKAIIYVANRISDIMHVEEEIKQDGEDRT